MRMKRLLIFAVLFLCAPTLVRAQAWSGIISPSRATDWTQAGIPGGLPDGSWTQCGSTIAAYTGSASAIQSVINGCSANQYVLLGPGKFNINAGQIRFPASGHVVLRGSGSNSTFLVFSGSAGSGCGQSSAFICGVSNDGTYTNEPPPNVFNWTGGYSKGSTQITLSGVSNINLNTTMIFLDQCDSGWTGNGQCSGSSKDNGQLFVCQDSYTTSPTGCSADGPDSGGSRGNGNTLFHRGQMQIVTATAINQGGCGATCVTISSPIVAPNWSASQNPQAWIVQPIVQVGVENMSLDGTSSGTAEGVEYDSCLDCWVSGVRFVTINTWGINCLQCAYGVYKDNYFWYEQSSDSYGIRQSATSFMLTQNNIFQRKFGPIVVDGSSTGNVYAYNFMVNGGVAGGASDFMRSWGINHANNEFTLWEGNIAPEQYDDGDHGTTGMNTNFRNFYLGWESCANGQCGGDAFKDSSTNALNEQSYDRYANIIGNVLGTPGYHTQYKTGNGSNVAVLSLGSGNGGVSIPVPSDPLVNSTALFWGNYDVATAAVRFCGNSSDSVWASVCNGTSEVPTGASLYPNSVPTAGDTAAGQSPMPASFYLSSKPSWFGSAPFPVIGPDVTGGNIGQCTGTLNTPGHYSGLPATSSGQCTGTSLSNSAWGGHVNANPAMNCYLNVMGGVPDGTVGVLAFDAGLCYGGSSGTGGSNPPAAPTNVKATVNTSSD